MSINRNYVEASKIIAKDIIFVTSPFKTVHFQIFFVKKYYDKINGCNLTKLTGMKKKKKIAIYNKIFKIIAR